ncbi:hypothetical protein AX16_001605, partial [Volvariella volvacea WC 439]
MAIWTDRTESLNGVDVRTGDRTFQSIGTVLNPNRPHDYRDDLQSFFWSIVWVGLRFDSPNQPKAILPDLLRVWSGENARLGALERRFALEYFEDIVIPNIGVGFTLPFINLLRALRDLIWAQCHEANKPFVPCSCPGRPTTLEELCPSADEDYISFLAAIEEAIEGVEGEETRQKLEDERKREATGLPRLRSHSANTKAIPVVGSNKESSNSAVALACPRHPKKAMQPPKDRANANINSDNPAT